MTTVNLVRVVVALLRLRGHDVVRYVWLRQHLCLVRIDQADHGLSTRLQTILIGDFGGEIVY